MTPSRSTVRRLRRVAFTSLSILSLAVTTGGAERATDDLETCASPPPSGVVIPGEFELHDAMLIGLGDMLDYQPELAVDLIATLRADIQVIAMTPDARRLEVARKLLADRDLEEDVRLMEVPHDTMWARDYGPIAGRRLDGEVVYLDPLYGNSDRTRDDAVPIGLAEALGIRVQHVPIKIDGGNLLSNGQGLLLTTDALLFRNRALGYDLAGLTATLERVLGARQIVFLEPLADEPTGHVDLFVAFTDVDSVVVAHIDPGDDREHAAILDRNAALLARLTTEEGPMRVTRLDMGPPVDGVWRTYTNVVFANGVVLVPSYGPLDRARGKRALDTWRRLLPTWKVRPVDATRLSFYGGALHCVTRNILLTEPSVKRANAGRPPASRR